ncbi:MAG: 6-phosphogluconolactonase [Pseudomonadales bacterium]|nr:6-phosphogluconolactonase [Pseudomonadales bacterium]
MMINEHLFTDYEELQIALTERFISTLSKALVDNGHAVVAVPGGATPVPLFQTLAKQDFDWSNITFMLTDERWVKNTHSDSNENLLRRHFLDATQARFIPLKSEASTASEGQEITEKKLQHILFPTDICLLGMGEDGHIASLFPEAPELVKALDMQSKQLCIAITPPNMEQERLSLTLNALLNTRQLILLIKGDKKRKIYLEAKDAADNIISPIGHILHQSQAPIDVYWTA